MSFRYAALRRAATRSRRARTATLLRSRSSSTTRSSGGSSRSRTSASSARRSSVFSSRRCAALPAGVARGRRAAARRTARCASRPRSSPSTTASRTTSTSPTRCWRAAGVAGDDLRLHRLRSTPTRVPWYCRLHDAHHPHDGSGISTGAAAVTDLGDRDARRRSADALKRELKRLRHPELESAVDEIAARLASARTAAASGSSASRSALPHAQSRRDPGDGARAASIEFGAHTGVARDSLQAHSRRAARRDRALDPRGERI